jgi:hypothetical protein
VRVGRGYNHPLSNVRHVKKRRYTRARSGLARESARLHIHERPTIQMAKREFLHSHQPEETTVSNEESAIVCFACAVIFLFVFWPRAFVQGQWTYKYNTTAHSPERRWSWRCSHAESRFERRCFQVLDTRTFTIAPAGISSGR